MRTRHEQVQAYRFVTRRITSAMLSGEPETAELPMRRLALSMFGSLVVAAIVLAGIGIYGFVNPAGGRPAENDIVIMRETGSRFVYLDGHLHPVLNLASARLIVGAAAPNVRSMSRRSLQDIPRGRPVGIPGAPDPPPDRAALLGLPWSVCSARSTGNPAAVPTGVVLGRTPAGRQPLGDQALLVTADNAEESPVYLLWRDRRLKIDGRTALTALDLASTTPLKIGAPLLNSIAAGPDLARPRLAGDGTPSPRPVAGGPARIGQVYQSGRQYWVATDTGLAAIGEVSAALLLADATAVQISAAQAAQAQSAARVEADGFPQTRPVLRTGATGVCAVYRAGGSPDDRPMTTVEVSGAGAEPLAGGADDTLTVQDGVRRAERVIVPGGRGALVRAMPVPGVTAATTVYLVTDQGYAYALRSTADVDAQEAMGYGGVQPLSVPAALLSLVPSGPVLDPEAARSFVGGGSAPGGTGGTAGPTPRPSPSRSARVAGRVPGRRRGLRCRSCGVGFCRIHRLP